MHLFPHRSNATCRAFIDKLYIHVILMHVHYFAYYSYINHLTAIERMIVMAVSKKYTKLSEIENFQSGYIIICDTLFEVLHRSVISSWDLYAKSIEKKVMEARRIANIRNTQQIVVDDINVFDEYIVAS